MELKPLGRPWSWLYNLAGRLGEPRDGIRIIGGARGPTALFVANRRRPGKAYRQNGVLSLQLRGAEALAALGLALGLLASVALLAYTLYHSMRKSR